jgi:hypothetical protein
LPQKAGLNRPMVFWGFIAAPEFVESEEAIVPPAHRLQGT